MRGPRIVIAVLVLSVALMAALAVGMRDSYRLQLTAFEGSVREQCTGTLAVRLQVGSSYSIKLGKPIFDSPRSVISSFTIRLEERGGQARLGRLREGRVRCQLGTQDGKTLRVTSLEVLP